MRGQQESEAQFRPWTTQQIAGAIFAIVVAGGGSAWLGLHQSDDGRELGIHSKAIEALESRVAGVEAHGSSQVPALDARITSLEGRVQRLEQGQVTRGDIENIQRQINDANKQSEARDADIKASVDTLIKAVWGDTTRRLGR